MVVVRFVLFEVCVIVDEDCFNCFLYCMKGLMSLCG